METDKIIALEKLEEILGRALTEVLPFLEKPVNQDILKRLQTDLMALMGHQVAWETARKDDDQYSAQQIPYEGKTEYAEADKSLLTSFLNSIPHVTGSISAADKDRLDNLLLHGLGMSDVQLSDVDKSYVVNRIREAVKMYAGLAKVYPEYAQEVFDDRVKSLLDIVKSKMRQRTNENSYNAIKERLARGLKVSELGLPNSKIDDVAEQMMFLAQDYVSAPAQDRDELYRHGEDRIIISAFDPTSFPQTMSRGR
jgi:hypothetical protein